MGNLRLTACPQMAETILKRLKPVHLGAATRGLAQIEVIRSNLFPYDAACTVCGGTGDGGYHATYCGKCGGAGKRRIIGCLSGGASGPFDPLPLSLSLIEGARLRPLFQPSFPSGLVPLPPLAKGLI